MGRGAGGVAQGVGLLLPYASLLCPQRIVAPLLFLSRVRPSGGDDFQAMGESL